jgi:hypothetical protein
MAVIIGVDPHKATPTAVAIDRDEGELGRARVRATHKQVPPLLHWAEPLGERTWAIESAGGLGYLLAQQLVAAGETVLDGDGRADDDPPTRVRNHPGEVGSNAGSNRGARPIRPNPVADRSPRSEGISRTVVHRPGLLRGAGGNRTPVRRAVADRATTIPEIYGSTAAAPPGRWASRGGRRRVCSPMPAVFPAASGLSRRQSPLLLPGCGDQALRALTGRGCSRCAWRSGDEGVLLIGSCVCAPFKESEQLRSHDSASGPDVETDQPRWWYRLSSSFTILPAF